jgi:hemerythrin-like domain-containing protein
MDGPVDNSSVLAELSRQHDELRALLAGCEAAAEQIEQTGSREGRPLVRAATALLEALTDHNAEEEQQLRPILLEADAFGEVRVEQMIDEHVAEHAQMVKALREVVLIEAADQAARAVRPCLARIRRHLDAEEAGYLNERVIRDDLVTIDPTGG